MMVVIIISMPKLWATLLDVLGGSFCLIFQSVGVEVKLK